MPAKKAVEAPASASAEKTSWLVSRAIEQAIKALTLVLQAGNFGLVAFDVAEAPPHALQRLPFTTWRRLQRIHDRARLFQTAPVRSGFTRSRENRLGINIREPSHSPPAAGAPRRSSK